MSEPHDPLTCEQCHADGTAAEVQHYREFFLKIATAAGEDVSDGAPTWPAIEVWALNAVEQMRRDYDEELGGGLA